jgi:transposase InsO family protein
MNAFVDAHRAVHGVEPICKVLRIAPSTDYLHAARQTDPGRRSARALLDERLCEPIRRVWEDNFQVYGADKVWRQLRREGVEAARCTVERLMRRLGLKGARRGKPVKTTVSDRDTPGPPDRVNRRFTADRPNTLWVADFSVPQQAA